MRSYEDIPPSDWEKEVEQLIAELENYLTRIEKIVTKSHKLETNIRIIINKGTDQYYLHNKKTQKVQYIPKKEIDSIKEIAQLNYYRKLIPKIKNELDFLKNTLNKFKTVDIKTFYDHISEKRKKILTPPTLTNKEYEKKWMQIKYNSKKFEKDEKYITTWGLKVRSKSEIIIAETLKKHNIPFRYEYPIKLNGYIVYPDFYCLNVRTRKEYIWEHLGKLDDVDYISKNHKKFAAYTNNKIAIGDNLIITYETQNYPLTKKMIELQIEKFLK